MIFKTLAFILGFTCFIVQIVLLREFMSLFMGNELVIAIILALWMLTTAVGAWIGNMLVSMSTSSAPLFTAMLLCGASPILGVFFTLWLRTQMYTPGVMVGLHGSILLSLTGLLLFCTISGMMYTFLATSMAKTHGRDGIVKIYAIEALGSLVGGLLFNFILVYNFASMQVLVMLMIINFTAATIYALVQKKTIQAAFGLLALAPAVITSFTIDMEEIALSSVFPGREVVMSKDTPFGKLVATEQHGQSDIYLDGQVLVSSGEISIREEKIHYALSLHQDPGNILLLFGGLDGSPAEVCKYQPAILDYVDQDPWSIEFADQLKISDWPEGINVHITDPKSFFNETAEKYDVIFFNGPDPNTIGNNRFYTRDFYLLVKEHLHESGIYSTSLPAAGNYLSEELKMLFSSIHNTLKTEFEYVRIIPGVKTYLLASDTPLQGDITGTISELGILTDYVNLYYIDDRLIAQREQLILEQLDEHASINTTTRPIAAYLSILGWLGLQQLPLIPLILIPLVLMGLIIFRMSQYNIGLFTTGFTASSGEFLLLIAFQSIYGFIYEMAGLIIMIFMAGLFAGAGFLFRFFKTKRQSFMTVQVFVGLICLLIPLLILYPGAGWMPGVLIGVLTFIIAVLTGIQYQLASHLRHGSMATTASSTYGADLAGSAFGIFFVGVFVFPLLGIISTVVILTSINILLAFVLYLKKGRAHA
jgi:spermidine synthase